MSQEGDGRTVRPPTVVFLDRDGTIIRDAHFLKNPAGVELLPGSARAVRRLNDARVPVILVTNQSGIGRGFLSQEDYRAVHARMEQLLAAHAGARLDASYFCPHRPEDDAPCACRKPGAGLFRQAVKEHRLDVASPAFIGDRWRDLAPMQELGGSGILVHSPATGEEDLACATAHGAPVVPSLAAAVDRLLPAE